MKYTITKHFFLTLIAFAVLALSSCDLCCKHKPCKPDPGVLKIDTAAKTGGGDSGGRGNFIPISVAGIVIDQSGGRYMAATGRVVLTGATGPSGTPTQSVDIASGAYSVPSFNTGIIPATITCSPTDPSGPSFCSTLSTSASSAAVVDIVLNTSKTQTAPQAEFVFINAAGTTPAMPTAMSLTIESGAAAGSQVTIISESMVPSSNLDLVIFSPIAANTKYQFNYTPAGGAATSIPFTTPATIAAKGFTDGYTIVVP
jgi:hypothetical protein